MDLSPLPQVSPGAAAVPDAQQQKALRQATKQFEGLFLAQLLKSMRATVPRGATSSPASQEVLGGFAEMELGRVLAERRGIGLSDMLYRSLQPRTAAGPSAGPEPKVHARALRPRGEGDFRPIVERMARRYNLSPSLLRAVIAVESGGNPEARSPRDAKGLMQLMDSTARMLGVKDVWDPLQNIEGGARYLRRLLDRFDGRLELALAAYNAGPGAVSRHRGIPPYAETRTYVQRVMEHMRTGTEDTES